MSIRVAAIVAAMALAAAAPVSAQPAAVGPTWTSAQIRDARPLAPEPMLAFDVRQETTSTDSAVRTETSRVVLAPDFVLVTSGRTHTLDDFALHRTFIWSDGAPSFASLNGHAQPAFRAAELANRKFVQAVLTHLQGTTGKSLGPSNDSSYWREAELGISDPPDTPLTLRPTGSGTDFLLGSDPVVQASGQAVALTGSDRRPLLRYFALHLPLHPQVRHALADARALPARLVVQAHLLNRKRTIVFTLSGATRATIAYPLPAGLQPDVEEALGASGTGSAPGMRAALDVIHGRYTKPKPAADAMLAALRKAETDGRSMEVWLWFNAYLQQYGFQLKGPDGQATIQALAPLIRAALQDPQVARFAAASALSGAAPNASGDRQEAARYIASAKSLDALPFGTFRYVTFANLVAGAKDAGKWDKAIFAAMPSPVVANYWTHIAAYPWSANAYKDAGDAYFRSFDTPKAWTAFDLGRAVDPDWRSSNLKSVANYEAVLESKEPDFF